MTQELSTQSDNAAARRFILDTVMPGASEAELHAFMHVAKATGLDPVKRQIFAVLRWNKKLGREQWTTQCSVDGFRAVAEATQDYEGQVGPFWCGVDGIWRDVWLTKGAPAAAKVGVWRKGFREPLYRIALWSEYAQKDKDGKLTKFWTAMPALMLAKCAESLALRGAFPQKLSGLYTSDEMSQEIEVESEPVMQAKPLPATQKPPVEATASVVRPKAAEITQSQPAVIPEPKSELSTMIARAAGGGPPDLRVVSEAQLTRLFAIGKSRGWTPEQIGVVCKSRLGIASRKSLLVSDYETIVNLVNSHLPSQVEELRKQSPVEDDVPHFDAETMGTSMGGA